MKLHLGCGEVHLDGYTNIDYPPTEHTIQKTSIADKYCDITKLKYPLNSIEEVRLHHVFEHFPRAKAIALFVSWVSWLKVGGKLTIEVPDFQKMSKIYNSPLSSIKQKNIAIRHIFGSQEAEWAVHYHGWSARDLLDMASFARLEGSCHRSQSQVNIHNITFVATKTKRISRSSTRAAVVKYLSHYMVDQSVTKKNMLKEWMKSYDEQVAKSWGK